MAASVEGNSWCPLSTGKVISLLSPLQLVQRDGERWEREDKPLS